MSAGITQNFVSRSNPPSCSSRTRSNNCTNTHTMYICLSVCLSPRYPAEAERCLQGSHRTLSPDQTLHHAPHVHAQTTVPTHTQCTSVCLSVCHADTQLRLEISAGITQNFVSRSIPPSCSSR